MTVNKLIRSPAQNNSIIMGGKLDL